MASVHQWCPTSYLPSTGNESHHGKRYIDYGNISTVLYNIVLIAQSSILIAKYTQPIHNVYGFTLKLIDLSSFLFH